MKSFSYSFIVFFFDYQPQQMVQSVSDSLFLSNQFQMHQIHAHIRIPPRYGGNANVTQPVPLYLSHDRPTGHPSAAA
ncbi:unnamed protein product [Penicillium salamii]|nr:unnamed protein product [Penicillium salamii]